MDKILGTHSTGQAIVVIEHGEPRVLVRESAPPGVLKEEGIHLWQSADPRTAGQVAALDESRLARWDSLSVGEKIDAYRAKLDLEVDGQHRLIAHLDEKLHALDLDPQLRTVIEADLRLARQTLENLHGIKAQVDGLTPDALLLITRGERAAPVDLDQPSRLFAKKTKAGRLSEVEALERLGEITPIDDGPVTRRNLDPHRIGPEFYDGKKGPYRNITYVDKEGQCQFTVEIKDVDGDWVERGERRRARGLSLEEAPSELKTMQQAAAAPPGERYISLRKPLRDLRLGPRGFNDVIIIVDRRGNARIKLVEVKGKKGYVSAEELTAIDDNIRVNLDELRFLVNDQLGELQRLHGLSDAQIRGIAEALEPRQLKLDVEVRLGAQAMLGTMESGTVLRDLQGSLRKRYRRGVNVLNPVKITPADVAAARALADGAPRTVSVPLFERVGELAATPTGFTVQSGRQAHALALAERNPALGPVQRGPAGVGFFDEQGRPVLVTRAEAPAAGSSTRRRWPRMCSTASASEPPTEWETHRRQSAWYWTQED